MDEFSVYEGIINSEIDAKFILV